MSALTSSSCPEQSRSKKSKAELSLASREASILYRVALLMRNEKGGSGGGEFMIRMMGVYSGERGGYIPLL